MGLTFDLRRLLRWAGYSVAIVIVSGAAGFFLSNLRTEVYAARTEILFPLTNNLSSGFLREDRRLVTQIESIRSRAILGPVADSQGLSVSEIEDRVSAQVVSGSEIIRIEARSEDPAEAVSIVDAVSSTYLALVDDSRAQAARALYESERGAIAEERTAAETRLDELEGAVASLPEGEAVPSTIQAEMNSLTVELVALDAREADLEDQAMDFEIAQALQPSPVVLTPPYQLADPVEPNVLFDTALAAAVGATIAAGLLAVLIARTVGVGREPAG